MDGPPSEEDGVAASAATALPLAEPEGRAPLMMLRCDGMEIVLREDEQMEVLRG